MGRSRLQGHSLAAPWSQWPWCHRTRGGRPREVRSTKNHPRVAHVSRKRTIRPLSRPRRGRRLCRVRPRRRSARADRGAARRSPRAAECAAPRGRAAARRTRCRAACAASAAHVRLQQAIRSCASARRTDPRRSARRRGEGESRRQLVTQEIAPRMMSRLVSALRLEHPIRLSASQQGTARLVPPAVGLTTSRLRCRTDYPGVTGVVVVTIIVATFAGVAGSLQPSSYLSSEGRQIVRV